MTKRCGGRACGGLSGFYPDATGSEEGYAAIDGNTEDGRSSSFGTQRPETFAVHLEVSVKVIPVQIEREVSSGTADQSTKGAAGAVSLATVMTLVRETGFGAARSPNTLIQLRRLMCAGLPTEPPERVAEGTVASSPLTHMSRPGIQIALPRRGTRGPNPIRSTEALMYGKLVQKINQVSRWIFDNTQLVNSI